MFNADVTHRQAGSGNAGIGGRWLAVAVTCSLALLASFAVAPSASANPCLGENPTAPICDKEPGTENSRPTIQIVSPMRTVSPFHSSSSPRDQPVQFSADANDVEDGVPHVRWVAYRCAFIHELGCTRSAGVWVLGEGTNLVLAPMFLDLGTTFGSSTWSYYARGHGRLRGRGNCHRQRRSQGNGRHHDCDHPRAGEDQK